MRQHESRFTSNDGLSLFYRYWLPDDRPRAVLALAHGMGEHSGRYQNYVDYFVPRGYGLYAMDLRGCGQSEGRRGHVHRFDDFLDDLRQLHDLARLAASSVPVILLGHSFGSLIALAYGLRFPEGLAGAIASVDHWSVGEMRSEPRRALLRMPQNDDIAVRVHHFDRVRERLTLCH